MAVVATPGIFRPFITLSSPQKMGSHFHWDSLAASHWTLVDDNGSFCWFVCRQYTGHQSGQFPDAEYCFGSCGVDDASS